MHNTLYSIITVLFCLILFGQLWNGLAYAPYLVSVLIQVSTLSWLLFEFCALI